MGYGSTKGTADARCYYLYNVVAAMYGEESVMEMSLCLMLLLIVERIEDWTGCNQSLDSRLIYTSFLDKSLASC